MTAPKLHPLSKYPALYLLCLSALQIWVAQIPYSCKTKSLALQINPSNAEANFDQSTKTQRFLKTI